MPITTLLTPKQTQTLIFCLALAIGVTSNIDVSAWAQRLPETLIANLDDITPPDTSPPGHSKPGGSLNPSTTCGTNNENDPKLTALVPEEAGYRFTLSENPSLWLYIPYTSQQVRYGEFSVLVGRNESEKHVVRFTLPATPGIARIPLPDALKLQKGENYHWYFNLYCRGNSTSTDSASELEEADEIVDGWFQRIAHTPEREQRIKAGEPDIWYDALTLLVEQRLNSPQDEALEERLRMLLSHIDQENLVKKPLIELTIRPPTSEPVTN